MAFRVTISHPFDINGLWLNEATMVKCWERKNYSDEEGRLTIRDYPADQGQEPNPEFDKKFTWNSPDIWNNVTIDGPIHQIFPTIKADLKNNIHFRVWNKGCQTSKVPDDTKRKNQIFLYYQADRELPWWDGGFRTPRGIEGDLLGTDTIPPLEPGEYYQGQISYTLVDVPEQENNYEPGEYLLGRIYDHKNRTSSIPYGALTNSNNHTEKEGKVRTQDGELLLKENIEHFSLISGKNSNLLSYMAIPWDTFKRDPGLSPLYNPDKKDWKGIHSGEENLNADLTTNIIVKPGKPTYGLLQTDLNRRPSEYTESLGTMKLQMNEPLMTLVEQNEKIKVKGMELRRLRHHSTIFN